MDEMIQKALSLQMNGFITEAIQIYEKALRNDSRNAKLYEYYGAALAANGRFNEAKQYLTKALDKNIQKPQVLNNLATVNRSLQLYEEALLNVKSALKFRPNYRDAWINRGNLHSDLRQWEEAAKCYKNAIELDPSELEPFLFLAVSLLHSNQYEDALGIYKKLQERSNDSRLLTGELICYRAMGDYDKALDFALNLKKKYNNEIMTFEYAQTLWMAGNIDQAKEQIDLAIEQFGTFPEIVSLKELTEGNA